MLLEQVTYVMLELVPKLMGQPGRKSCEDTLHLLASSGYTLYDLTIPNAGWQFGNLSGATLLQTGCHTARARSMERSVIMLQVPGRL